MSAYLGVRKVLLVEDNPGDADYIRELLTEIASEGLEVEHVLDLTAALAALRNFVFELVLLDLRLPDATGGECVERLCAVRNDIPIVVLTRVEDEALALQCLARGAQDYITKLELQPQLLRRAIAFAAARSREVIERRRAESLQSHLAAIVDASSDAIVSCTPDGTLTSWNRGAENIFGYLASEVLGRSAHDFLFGVDSQGERERDQVYRQALLGVVPRKSRQVVKVRKDGTHVTLSSVVCTLQDEEGRVVGLAGIYRDLTDLQERDLQMRALANRLNLVRETERKRISRAVHDELGQLLTGLKMDLSWIERRLSASPLPVEAIAQKLVEAESLLDTTVGTVQQIAIELRPSTLDALGLAAALRDEGRRFEQRSSISVRVEVAGDPQPSDDIATELFRVYQELLTNVARHSQATALEVRLEDRDGRYRLQVSDNGVGFDEEKTSRIKALGLLGIRERAESLGGQVAWARGAAGGTQACIEIPHLLGER